jgi:hypothetical protein
MVDWLVELYAEYPESEIVQKYYDSIKGLYQESYLSYDKIEDFRGGYAVYELDGKKGLLDTDGDVVVEAVYDEIEYNGTDKDSIAVSDGGDCFLINQNGYRTNKADVEYESFGILSQKRVLAEKNGKYGYLDEKLNEKIDFIYDDGTAFLNDVAAVRQGEKWALIDKNGEALTEYLYDDVAVNSTGYVSVNEVIWVRQGSTWSLINTKGEAVGTDTYEDVKAFESGQYCAVCKDGKWGFADTSGTLVIDCSYEDAKSFTNGLAPVEKSGLWGYVDLDDYLTIDCEFMEAGHMTKSGIAPVSRGGAWTLIELKIMQ